ncbi:cytochrome P450 [Amanita rubescens]|nr:cytochrome P450 [Amanita rubescens]
MAPVVTHISQVTALLSDILRPLHIGFLVAGYVIYRIVHHLVLWPRYLSPLRHVPTAPGTRLITGHMHIIINNQACIPHREWAKKLGPVVRFFGLLGFERLFFLQPELLHQILVKGWLDYPRPPYLRHLLGITTGYGLLTVTGDEHRLMKKAMNPAFSMPNLMSQIHTYYNSIDGLVKLMHDQIDAQKEPMMGKVMHMYDWLSKATLDIICETAFGYKTDSLHNPENELAVAYERLLGLQNEWNIAKFVVFLFIPGFPQLLTTSWMYKRRRWFEKTSFTAELSTLLESMHTIRKVSMELLQEKMNDSVAVSDTDAKRDIMSILVRARKADLEKDKTVYAMSDKAMIDQVLTFLGAGHETSASGLAWTLWLLANNQEAQSKLREEVAPVLRKDPHPDYRTLKELQWLDCVVMESLRVLPPVPLTFRIAEKTDYIGDILVPKGTHLLIPVRVVNTYKDIWGEDAEEFKPSRWLNLPDSYNPNYSFLSFIAGPHACIGKTMAIMEMKAILASLINNFSFEPSYAGQVIKSGTAITMKPTDGMPLLVKPVR